MPAFSLRASREKKARPSTRSRLTCGIRDITIDEVFVKPISLALRIELDVHSKHKPTGVEVKGKVTGDR